MVPCRRKSLSGPVSWKTFSEVFLAKFFPDTTKTEMEQKFINLEQADKTINEYAAKVSKLSRFAPYMVSIEGIGSGDFSKG